MNKNPKFLVCENPIADQSDGRLFILHNGSNIKLLAEVISFELLSDPERMAVESNMPSIYGRLDYFDQQIYFAPLWMIGDEKYHLWPDQKKADKLAGIMRRMADWYQAYLIWENNQL